MIPQAAGIPKLTKPIAEPSSRTFRLVGDRVIGMVDGAEAMMQAIYLALATERFQWVIFSWNYGAELEDLLGMPLSWVKAELKRRIAQALLQDRRITAVDEFSFERGRSRLTAHFTVRTVFGDIQAKKEVIL